MLASSTEIIALIISGFSGLATIAAFLSCYFTYLSTKPKIKLKILKAPKNEPLTIFSYDSNKKFFSVICVELNNVSAIAGSLFDFYLKIGGICYSAESIYDENTIGVTITRENAISGAISNPDMIRLKLPVTIPAYSSLNGYFAIPSLPLNKNYNFTVQLVYQTVGKRKQKKKITLTYQSPLLQEE